MNLTNYILHTYTYIHCINLFIRKTKWDSKCIKFIQKYVAEFQAHLPKQVSENCVKTVQISDTCLKTRLHTYSACPKSGQVQFEHPVAVWVIFCLNDFQTFYTSLDHFIKIKKSSKNGIPNFRHFQIWNIWFLRHLL